MLASWGHASKLELRSAKEEDRVMLRLLVALALLLRIAMPATQSQTQCAAPSVHAARASAVVASMAIRVPVRESARTARGERFVCAPLAVPSTVGPASFTRAAAPEQKSASESGGEVVSSRARGPPTAA